MIKISFVIPAYNEEKYIGDCLRSILPLRDDPSIHQIIVVDNGSTDGTRDVARSFPDVLVVEEPEKSLSKARQRGFAIATGNLLASIDADNRIDRAWLDRVKEHFETSERLVCLSGPYRCTDIPRWQTLLLSFLEGAAQWVRYVLGIRENKIAGGNAVYRMDALRSVGGFDVSHAFYGEDEDTLQRISAVGDTYFDRSLRITSSGRRIKAEGLIRLILRQKLYALRTMLTKKTIAEEERDYR